MRVDYLTVQSREDDGAFAGVAENVWRRALQMNVPSKAYRATPLPDTISRPRGFRFMIWGEEAHNLFLSLKPDELNFVTRLDVRRSWTGIPGNRDFAELVVNKVASSPKVGRANMTLYKSRPRSNAHGRDTGGYGFRLGSLKSERSFKLYVRGHEGMVTEVTVQDGRMPYVLRMSEAILAHGFADNMHDAVVKAACEEGKIILCNNTGFTTYLCDYLAQEPDSRKESIFRDEGERLSFFHNLLAANDKFVVSPEWSEKGERLC